MASSTEAPTETPSHIIEEQTYTILKAKNVRDQFNNTISCYKALNNTRTTVEFLQHCLKSKIIPPTFVIKNSFYNNTDQNETKIKNLLYQTSTTLIKITIDSLKTKEHSQFKRHLDELHILLNLIQKEEDRDKILDKCSLMETKFREQSTEKSIQRLKWLKQSHRTTEPPDHRISPNINKNDTPTNTNDKHKRKHRRFIKRTKWQNIQKKKTSEQITAIYNYSTMTLTGAMSRLLNRGLNFCVTPNTLNVTELLVDYRKFERKMRWKEFFNDNEDDNSEYTPPIFPREKSNLPPKGGAPLNNFLIGVNCTFHFYLKRWHFVIQVS